MKLLCIIRSSFFKLRGLTERVGTASTFHCQGWSLDQKVCLSGINLWIKRLTKEVPKRELVVSSANILVSSCQSAQGYTFAFFDLKIPEEWQATFSKIRSEEKEKALSYHECHLIVSVLCYM